jgi:hypothetical protein
MTPLRAVTTPVNNVPTYSCGMGGGSALKFAVKLPNFVILSRFCNTILYYTTGTIGLTMYKLLTHNLYNFTRNIVQARTYGFFADFFSSVARRIRFRKKSIDSNL